MLTDETFPRFLRRDPALDGGHHRAGFSFGDFWSPGDVTPGRYQGEKTTGREMTTVCRAFGEPVEVRVTDKEVKVCCDNLVMAIYDRGSGALTSVSFSLAQMSQGGNDLTVVIKLDEDGEGRGTVVLSDSAGVVRPIAAAKMTDLIPEESTAEDGETDELLQAWHCVSSVGKIDFCVGIRVFSLDLMIFNPTSGEVTLFHVAQSLDFSLLDREGVSPGLVLELAADAFPGIDWV